MKVQACPCGSGRPFAACCEPTLSGQRPAPDAETLMRSRYVAYSLGDAAYLLATWHADSRPETLDLETQPRAKWIGLEIRAHRQLDDDHAEVEFIARYRINGRAQRLHETSRFVREHDQWYYLDGDIKES